jgi:hypothetical protein
MRNAKVSTDNNFFIENLLSLHPIILVEQIHSMTGAVDAVVGAVVRVKNTMIIKISVLTVTLLFVVVIFWRRGT